MMHKTLDKLKFSSVLFLLAIVSIAPLAVSSTIYDLRSDWSDISNPNGVWTYRAGSVTIPSLAGGFLPGEFGPNQAAWAYTPDGGFAVWLKTNGTPNAYGQFPYDLMPGDVVVDTAYPGMGGVANVIWTSPLAGTLDYSGNIWLAFDRDNRATDWSLFLNGTLLNSGTVADGDIYNRANPMTFSGNGLAINPGDIVMLQAAMNPQSMIEFTGVNLTIVANPVPEPGSFILLSLGLVGLIGYGWRKRK
jgi:hypothetical protein